MIELLTIACAQSRFRTKLIANPNTKMKES